METQIAKRTHSRNTGVHHGYDAATIDAPVLIGLLRPLHRFNPLVFLMTKQASKDIELACDDEVTRTLSHEARTQYGNTLLTAIPIKRRLIIMCSTHFGSNKTNIRQRLQNIFDNSVKRRGIAALCAVALCAVLIAGTISFGYAEIRQDQYTLIGDTHSFRIDFIKTGDVVCIGKIELGPDVSYKASLSAETGGVMIALNPSPDIKSINGTAWDHYYSSDGDTMAFFSSNRPQTYFVYVGSPPRSSFVHNPFNRGSKQITGLLTVSKADAPQALQNDKNTIQVPSLHTTAPVPPVLQAEEALPIPVAGETYNEDGSFFTQMSTGDYVFHVPTIEAGKAICLGMLTLRPDIVYTPSFLAESGQGLYMALSYSDNITDEIGSAYLYFGAGSNIPLTSNQVETVYLYVGSSSVGGAKLTRVTGQLSANTANSGSSEAVSEAVINTDINSPGSEIPPVTAQDAEGIRIMEKSGTWGESMNRLVPLMSPEGVAKAVEIYLDKHLFPGISTPQSAKQVANTIEKALPYLTTEARSKVDAILANYTTTNAVSAGNRQVFRLSNHNGGKSIIKSGSFRAEAGQTLTLTVQSDIQGGTVDFFLFSPSGEENHFAFVDSVSIQTVTLSEGTWAYTCTGFFEYGNIQIIGTVS